jgi:hypothetical protein
MDGGRANAVREQWRLLQRQFDPGRDDGGLSNLGSDGNTASGNPVASPQAISPAGVAGSTGTTARRDQQGWQAPPELRAQLEQRGQRELRGRQAARGQQELRGRQGHRRLAR